MVTKVLARRRRRPILERLETRSLLAADLLGSAASAAAAFDAFLEIDGIPGESADVSHKETIEIESFSWGATQAGAFRPNAAAAEDFHFIAPVSSASPALFQAAASGEHIKKAVLYVRKAGGDQQDYLKVTLQDVLVSSVQGQSVNESTPLEEVGLRFGGIEEAYRPTLEDGSLGEPLFAKWDLKFDQSRETRRSSLLDEVPAGAADQVEAVLQIAGIQGDSGDAKHKEWIDIESFSWGMSNSALARGMSPGLLSMQDFHFVMPTGQASPQLLSSAASGKVISEAMLTVQRGVGQEVEYLKYKLENILVSSFQTQSLDSSVPMDEVTLNFTKLTQLYAVQDAAPGTPEEVKGVWSHRDRFALYQRGDSVLDETKAPLETAQVSLELDGIPGDTADAKHKETIEIESFSWGMSRAINGRSLTGSGGAGKVSVQDFHFVKRVNNASPDLMLASATGEHIGKAVLSVRKSGGDASSDYLKYKLSDLLVSSYQIQSVDESLPLEEFTLRFRTLQEAHTATAQDGSPSDFVQPNWIVPASAARSLGESVLGDTTAAPRAVDMFLEIDGVSGESAAADHKGEIEILSFSWGLTQTGAFDAGGRGGAGRLSLEPLHVVTVASEASPPLFSAVLSGHKFSDATLYIREAGSADRMDYLKIKLSDVLVSSYQTRSIDQSLPLDEVTLNFARLAPSYQLQDASGEPSEVSTEIAVRARRDVFVPGDDLLDITAPPTETTAAHIKFDGIDGEAAVGGEIEVQSFSWGVSNPSSLGQGGGGGAGKVSMQDFHFVATPNSASPELVLAAATGKHFAKVEILARRAGGDPYLVYKLSDVLVSSYQIAGSSDAAPLEEMTLNFTKLQQQYTGQDPTQPQPPVVQWSNATQRATYQRGESILDDTTAPATDGQAFLTVAGIPGESVDKAHKEWIDIDSFSWGMSQNITTRSAGGGGGAGKVSIQDFHFVADLSVASPQLLSAVARGKHFPDAVLTVRKTAAEPLDYLKYELKDVLVSSARAHGHGDSVPTDQFSLNFAKIKYSYLPPPVTTPAAQQPAGGAAADAFFATL